MTWNDVRERLDALSETIEDMPDAKTDLEAFVRVELANYVASARRVVNALANDEESTPGELAATLQERRDS